MNDYCTTKTLAEINHVKISARNCMKTATNVLSSCIKIAKTKLPDNVPFLDAVNKCP